MKPLHLLSGAVILCIAASGCSDGKKDDTKPVNVFTSILPQKCFVEKIGGDRVNAEVLVGPGKSPATYEITPQQIIALGSAEILFTIGVPFEQALLPSIEDTLDKLRIVDTSQGINKRKLAAHTHDENHHEDHEEEHEDHNDEDDHHEEKHEHEEGADDPHIWLSPSLVKIQAGHIYNALIEIDPEAKDQYKNGYDEFISELDEIDRELKSILAPFSGNILFVFHPAFGYFADSYGLEQVAIETGGKEPTPSQLEEIIEHALEEKVKILFVQPEFPVTAAEAIADSIDGAVVLLNPLDPDYINNLRAIASEIEKAFR